MIGRSVARATAAEMGHRFSRVGLVDHRRQDHQAVDADLPRPAAKRQASAVVHSATPVSTGTRPATCSTTAPQHLAAFRRYSSEQFSPTVPSRRFRERRPSKASTRREVPSRSSVWSSWNCVVAAGKTPRQFAVVGGIVRPSSHPGSHRNGPGSRPPPSAQGMRSKNRLQQISPKASPDGCASGTWVENVPCGVPCFRGLFLNLPAVGAAAKA